MLYIDDSFIKDRIAQLRIQKGVSARDMSLSIGQNKNYINRIENGTAFPSMNGLILICEYLNVTLKEFFDVENKSPDDIKKLNEEIQDLDSEYIQSLIHFIQGIKKNAKSKSKWLYA